MIAKPRDGESRGGGIDMTGSTPAEMRSTLAGSAGAFGRAAKRV